MLISMLALSLMVLAVAWQSFERNLGVRLGNAPRENGITAPGPLQSLMEDARRLAKGEKPLLPETDDAKQETKNWRLERFFSAVRETRRVIKYNIGEMQKWLAGLWPYARQ